MKSLKINADFDIVFNDFGELSISIGDEALESRIVFDITSNDEWKLKKNLGVGWLSIDNSGLLQRKISKEFLKSEIKKKILTNKEVIEIVEFTMIDDPLTRELEMTIEIKTKDSKIRLGVNSNAIS